LKWIELYSFILKKGERTLASKDRRKNLALLCLLLFVLPIGAVAFHHHDGDIEHDDCPICVATLNINTASLGFFTFAVFILVLRLETFNRSSGYDYLSRNIPLARAPPA